MEQGLISPPTALVKRRLEKADYSLVHLKHLNREIQHPLNCGKTGDRRLNF